MKNAYKFPLYYKIACSFFNVKKQINSFEKIIKKFSKRKVKKVLDVACGPSMQLIEFAKRGYEAVGLDISKEMLDYLQTKAKKQNLKIKTIKTDMFNFKLKEKVDFAFIMVGSFTAKSNEEYSNQLDSIANSLNKGGLYLIQNIKFIHNKPINSSWKIKEGKITVNSTYSLKLIDYVNQISNEEFILKVNDNGKKERLVHNKKIKMLYPEEFKHLIEKNGKFEFLGAYPGTYNVWFLNKPLEKAKDPNLNIFILRRK